MLTMKLRIGSSNKTISRMLHIHDTMKILALIILTHGGCIPYLSSRFLDAYTFYNAYPWFELAGTKG